jgi:hypothetical protein
MARLVPRRSARLALAALAAALLAPGPLAATRYYVDGRSGDDAARGTDPASPWRTLANLGTHAFAPGDSILLARGSSYVGGVVFRSSGAPDRPIVIAGWGTGPAPSLSNPDWSVLNGNVLRIEGSWVVVEGLYFHDNANAPTPENDHHDVQKMGAVYLGLRADHVVVRDCEFVRSPVGIKVKGRHARIIGNHLHDATEPMGRTWGAIAIMIVSPYVEVSHNRIENYGYYGGAYGSDGGAIELDGVDDAFEGHDVEIHHNVSIGNHGFLELAARVTENVTVAYNLSDDVDQFIGGGEMKRLRILNNTVVRTREPNVHPDVFFTFYPGSTLEVRNNVFVLPADVQVFAPFLRYEKHHRTGVGEQVRSNNLYFAPAGGRDPIGLPPAEGEAIADPRFVDTARHDYRPGPDSPARGRGVPLGYESDLAGVPLPPGAAPDVGAYQAVADR